MRQNKIFYILFFLCLFAGNALAKEPWETLFGQGAQAYQEGRLQEAVIYLEKAAEVNPEYAPIYNLLGMIKIALGSDPKDLLWLFNKAIELDPQYADAYANACRVYSQNGEQDKAEQACLMALKINPQMTNAQLTLAWVYLAGKRQPQNAVYYFNEVLKKAQSPMIYYGLGLAYVETGETAQVLEAITFLRNSGHVELAVQLENAIRQRYVPPTTPDLPERQAGTIVTANETPPEIIPEDIPQGINGSMRVRMKGKLNFENTEPKASSGQVSGERSSAERIREIQKIRQGQGTSGTTMGY